MGKKEGLAEFRRRVKEQREREWIRDAVHLRGRSPESTIQTMFDLIDFAEKLRRAEKSEA